MAGDIILHPNGFGQHSYAAWKAQVGLPDTSGNKNQALYFQKMTATTTFAAGVAVFHLGLTPTTVTSWPRHLPSTDANKITNGKSLAPYRDYLGGKCPGVVTCTGRG